MGYDIVKSITFKDNKVYTVSADGRSYPRTFHKWEVENLSEMYVKEGREAVLASFGENIWNGNLHLYKSGNKLCKLFIEARNHLPNDLNWSNFDSKTAGEFLAKAVIILENNPNADLSDDVKKLLSLRNNREHILEASTRTGQNFLNFADKEIQQDRDFALKILKAAGDRAWFDFPAGFEGDKEFALEAVNLNGCFYRSLDDSLKADKEIIFEAFEEREGRVFHEHMPDIIPFVSFFEFDTDPLKPTLDKKFVFDLIDCCPSMHIDRAKWLLEDRDIALKVCEKGKWIVFNADCIPEQYLKEKEFQDVLTGRCKDNKTLQKLKTVFNVRGIPFLSDSLENKILKAEEKQSDINNGEHKVSYKGLENITDVNR